MVVNKSKAAFRTIAEVADELDVATHVLRFWETKFSQIKPMKRGGGRRYYRPDDVEVIKTIKHYLYDERYTIEGVQMLFKEKGVKNLVGEEIQKDFFEVPEIELDKDTHEFLAKMQKLLVSAQEKLTVALEKSK